MPSARPTSSPRPPWARSPADSVAAEASASPASDGRRGHTVYEGAVQDLIDELGRLPGVGPKSAQRIAFHLLAAESADVSRLVAALQRVQEEVRFCTTCFNVAEGEQCRICRDPRRGDDVICVVEEPKEIGRAHV